MKARIHVDVEPLAEARWARIRRGVFDRIASEAEAHAQVGARRSRFRSRGWWWGAAAAAALSVAAAASLAVKWHAPSAVEAQANPSRIATGSAGSHVVLDGMWLDLAPESAVVMNGDAARGILVVLDRGSVTIDVEARVARAGFVVQAGEVRVRVVGTRFTVSRHEDGAIVQVVHGTVEVDARGEVALVHAGEKWPASPVVAAGAGDGPPSGVPVASSPARTRSLPATEDRGRLAAHGGGLPAGGQRGQPAGKAHEASEAVLADASATPPGSRSSQDLYEEAALLEASNPARAIAIYKQVAARRDSWLSNALFAQARLHAERGDAVQARVTLEEYLAAFPQGPNAEDARLLLGRLK